MGKGADRFKKTQTQYVSADIHKCKACWKCLNTCTNKVISKVAFLWHKHIVIKDADSCSGCQKCVKICPYGVFNYQ